MFKATQTPVKSLKKGAPLDTLAQLTTRAFSKYITEGLIFPLIDLNSEFKEKYWNTYHCVRVLDQRTDGKCTSKYCKTRWCVVCNRIRTAKLIKGYEPVIREMRSPQFLTLTAPTVEGDELKDEIERRTKVFRSILKKASRSGRKVPGLRKLEITYSHGKFHPHFHCVIEGADNANFILREWLSRNKGASIKGQDIRPCDESTLHEMFKYMTKMWSKGTDANVVLPYPPEAMDTIFQAMHKKRTVQSFGGLRQVKEEIDDEEATVYLKEVREVIWIWQRESGTWVDWSTGECRTDDVSNFSESLCNKARQKV